MAAMKKRAVRLVAIALAFQSIAWNCTAHVVVDEKSSSALDTSNPKFVGGIVSALLTNVIATGAQAMVNRFVSGMSNNLQGMDSSANFSQGGIAGNSSACLYSPASGSSITAAMRDEMRRTGCQMVAQFIGSAAQGLQSYVSNVVNTPGPALAPLDYNNGVPNYQGIRVAVELVDSAGNVIGERPIGDSFYSGEKFRLKVQSSFPGMLELIHTAPSGATKRLFPRPEIGQFMINAGAEVILPLSGNAYEFFGETGEEKLTFIVRDPRASQGAQVATQVYRQDGIGGSFYAQPVAAGQLPYIAQQVRIMHRNATR